MNKKKLFFLVGFGIFIFLIIIFFIFVGANSGKKTKKRASSSNFKIWLLKDDKTTFSSFIEDFKKSSKYTSFNPEIESFSDYEEYNLALASAFAKGEAPDLFMLNNNEKSLFLENIIGINPNIISPDIIRDYYKSFFGNDLIYSTGEKEKKQEYLIGIPFGYEPLGVFVNFKKIQNLKDLKNFSYIENLIREKSKGDFAVIGIGAGKTVKNSSDIFLQFLLSMGANSIQDLSDSDIKKAFTYYNSYFPLENNYSSVDEVLTKENKNNINGFVDGDIGAIFAYPRDIEKINELGFSKIALRATTFPEFINDSKYLVNYNYFVINKNSNNQDMALEFLKYLSSEKGEKKFLSHFKYYLPARVDLYDELLDDKINENFNIKRKHFYDSTRDYTSFDKGIKYIYDKNVVNLLDESTTGYRISSFIKELKCKTIKILKLENLSKNCG